MYVRVHQRMCVKERCRMCVIVRGMCVRVCGETLWSALWSGKISNESGTINISADLHTGRNTSDW